VTKLLEQAIQRIRQLPDNVQDSAARVLIAQLEEEPEPGELEAIKAGRDDFARGQYVTLDEWRDEMGISDH
jgi:predicted transcriptional regulator